MKFRTPELLGVPWIVVVGRGWGEESSNCVTGSAGRAGEIPVDSAADDIAGVLSC